MKQLTSLVLFIISAIIGFLFFQNHFSDRVDLLTQKSELGSKDNPIKRAEFEFRMLKNPTTGEIPKEIRRKEIEFVKNISIANEKRLDKISKIQALNFVSRGPVNRGGRVRALGIDLRSTAANSVIIAAGVSGGIWRSTNNGDSWIQTSLPSQINSATCIAQDRRSGFQDIWYIGTGESYGNSSSGGGSATYLGNGIYKSTNNGLSWNLLASTSSNSPQTFDNVFDFVHNIAVNPTTGTVYAAAINTIMSSKDGGNTWQSELSSPANSTFSDVIATSSGVVYASINSSVAESGIWKTTNDGTNWTKITPTDFPSTYNRVVIAVAPSNQNKIYLLANTVGSGKDGHSFWVSNDAGSSWTNYSSNLPDTKDPVAGYSSQGNYNMVIAVKPDDENFVVFGGTNLHRSTNGMTSKLANSYANWIGGYSVANDISQYANHHPDQHALVFAPYNSKMLFCGDDGGIQVTSDISKNIVAWIDKNNGFITSQFYSISLDNSANNDPTLLGGLQDNGNYFLNSDNATAPWVEMIAGGDGAFTAIADGKNYYYIETQEGNVIRLELYSSGDYKSYAVVKPNHETDYLFINPYVLDPNNSKMMYFIAGDSLWRNSDLTAIPNWGTSPTNVNWSVLPNTITGNMITAVSVSKTPNNIVYYGTADGRIFRLNSANVGNPVPTNVSNGLPDAYVSSIAVDMNDANNVLAVFSNYEVISLYHSTNGGSSWTAVAGNLEQNSDGSGNGPSCRWASILNFNETKTYFVATSSGLFSTNLLNGMSTNWVKESPNEIGVSVCTMVRTRDIDGTVVVATHGSGVYSGKMTSVDVKDNQNLPVNFELSQNYPNPFNPTTTINYSIISGGNVSLKVYNTRGEVVSELVNKNQFYGNYSVVFDASKLSSGTYIYELQSGNKRIAKKMILLK